LSSDARETLLEMWWWCVALACTRDGRLEQALDEGAGSAGWALSEMLVDAGKLV
jgi:hypothetical protein